MLKDSILIFINRFFVSTALVATTYLLAHNLPLSDYGHYQNFWSQFNTLYAFAGLGLASFVLTYPQQKIKYIIQHITKWQFLLGLVIVGICAMVFARLQLRANINVAISFTFLVMHTIGILLESLLVVFKKYKYLTIISVLYFLCFIGIHYYLLFGSKYNLNLLIGLLLVLVTLKVICSVIVLAAVFKHKETTQYDQKYKKLWMHLYLFDVVQILLMYADKFVVSITMSSATSAIYQNGTYSIPFLPIVFNAISSAALIHFAHKGEDTLAQRDTLRHSGKILASFVFPVFFFFYFFSEEFIVFYFSNKYLSSVPIFKIALLSLLFKTFNFTILLQRHEMGSAINKGVLVDVVTILVLIVPMYYLFDLSGIPLTFFFATLAQASYYTYHHQKILGMHFAKILPLTDWFKKTVVFGSLAFGLHQLTNLYGNAQWGMFASLLVIGVVALFFIVKEYKISR